MLKDIYDQGAESAINLAYDSILDGSEVIILETGDIMAKIGEIEMPPIRSTSAPDGFEKVGTMLAVVTMEAPPDITVDKPPKKAAEKKAAEKQKPKPAKKKPAAKKRSARKPKPKEKK